MFRGGEIAQYTGGTVIGGDRGRLLTGVGTDTRTLRPGDLYIPLRGERFDGHDFAEEAAERGAEGILIEGERLIPAPLWNRNILLIRVRDTLTALGDLARAHRDRLGATCIGITGSIGKTTVKDLVAAALARKGRTTATIGNHNNFIGVPETLFRAGAEDRFLVTEMGTDRPGEIARLAEIARPQIGAITHITETHLERMGSLATIAREKGSLFAALPASGRAVLRRGVPHEDALRERSTAPVWTVDIEGGADFAASDIVLDAGRTAFRIRHEGGSTPVALKLLGRHQVWNALLAFAVCRAAGLPGETIAAGFADAQPGWGRLSPRRTEGGSLVIEDYYNASPHSMQAGISLLASMPAGRRYAVLGDMLDLGDRARSAHRELGRRVAEAGIDRVIYAGTFAEAFGEGVRDAGRNLSLELFGDAEDAAAHLRGALSEGDVVLIKASRGMRFERIAEACLGAAAAAAS